MKKEKREEKKKKREDSNSSRRISKIRRRFSTKKKLWMKFGGEKNFLDDSNKIIKEIEIFLSLEREERKINNQLFALFK